jgi:hypothetical protein
MTTLKTERPQPGDIFRISTKLLFVQGVVQKVNRRTFTYTARYFADTYEFRLPLSTWKDAEICSRPAPTCQKTK